MLVSSFLLGLVSHLCFVQPFNQQAHSGDLSTSVKAFPCLWTLGWNHNSHLFLRDHINRAQKRPIGPRVASDLDSEKTSDYTENFWLCRETIHPLIILLCKPIGMVPSAEFFSYPRVPRHPAHPPALQAAVPANEVRALVSSAVPSRHTLPRRQTCFSSAALVGKQSSLFWLPVIRCFLVRGSQPLI